MSQQGTDRRQRHSIAQHGGGHRVAQQMRATAGRVDAGSAEGAYNSTSYYLAHNRDERRSGGDEHEIAVECRTPVLQVMQNRVANLGV